MKWIISVVCSILIIMLVAAGVDVVGRIRKLEQEEEQVTDQTTDLITVTEPLSDQGERVSDSVKLPETAQSQQPSSEEEQTAPNALPEPEKATAEPVSVNIISDGAGKKQETPHVIVMGDSRTVGLYCSMNYSAQEFPAHLFYHIGPEHWANFENTTFVAKGGEGYAWLEVYGLARSVSLLQENSVFVVWFGVNDLARVESYVNYINGAGLSFGVPVYYMTIGPCDGNWAENNPAVESFNAVLKTKLHPAVHVIDTYSFIKSGMDSGQFGTLDGLHYNYETCRAIYQYMIEEIVKNGAGH